MRLAFRLIGAGNLRLVMPSIAGNNGSLLECFEGLVYKKAAGQLGPVDQTVLANDRSLMIAVGDRMLSWNVAN